MVSVRSSVIPCTLEERLQTSVMCVPFVVFVKDLSTFGQILLLVNLGFCIYARDLMEFGS